jgi:hypothetical protein
MKLTRVFSKNKGQQRISANRLKSHHSPWTTAKQKVVVHFSGFYRRYNPQTGYCMGSCVP